MDNKQANATIAAAFHELAANHIKAELEAIESGEGRMVVNPFTGQETVMPISRASEALHHVLSEHDVLDDPESNAILQSAIRDYTHALMFKLCTALDQSDEFPNQAQIGLTLDATPIETYIHEIYYQAGKADESQPR